jgi:hypothetical protein
VPIASLRGGAGPRTRRPTPSALDPRPQGQR